MAAPYEVLLPSLHNGSMPRPWMHHPEAIHRVYHCSLLQRYTFYAEDCLPQPPTHSFKEPHVTTDELLGCFPLASRRNSVSILRNM